MDKTKHRRNRLHIVPEKHKFLKCFGSILARQSLNIMFEFGSTRFDESDSSVRVLSVKQFGFGSFC